MKIKEAGRLEKITVIGALLSFAISAVFVKFSGFTVSSLINLQNSVLKKALIDSSGLNTFGSVSVLFWYFFNIIVATAFLTLAFAFLASYGFYENRKKFGLVLSLIGGIVFFFFLGFTPASLIVAAGVALAGYSVIPLSNNYGQEFKKWIHFRVGSNSISRAHFIFNLFIAIAVFVAVLSSLAVYQAEFKSDLKQTIVQVVSPGLPKEIDQKTLDTLVDQQVEKFLASPIFSGYFRWLPVVSAFAIWAILEIARIFLPYLAGVFTAILIKLEGYSQ